MISTIFKPLSAQMFRFASQLACVALSATAGILSALAPPLTKDIVSLLSAHRQASERQELAHDYPCAFVICLEPEVADLDFEFPFLCGFGYRRDSVVRSRIDPLLRVLNCC